MTQVFVTVGGQLCPIAASTFSSNGLTCTTQAGQGANLNVTVNVQGQPSDDIPLKFSYDAPSVTSVTPSSGPTGTVLLLFSLYTYGPENGSVDIDSSIGLCVRVDYSG